MNSTNYPSGIGSSSASFARFDSLNCREKGSWPFGPSYAVALDASRNRVFCGSGGGVYVLDGSNPARPQKLSEAIRTRGVACGFCYQANWLYIAAIEAGLEIWDVANPADPVRLGFYETPGEASDVTVAGNYAYVADGDAGLHIIEFYGAGIEDKPSAELRPANGPIIVRGNLRLAAGASLIPSWLLDAAGRRIMELSSGDNDVSHLAPGVYFVCGDGLRGQGAEGSSRKVVVTR